MGQRDTLRTDTDQEVGYEPVRAARGRAISCAGWHQEAALRVLMNSLDPEVAEKPNELILCGGCGKAARDWRSFHAITGALRALENDQTLLVERGEMAGVCRTQAGAPRLVVSGGTWMYTGAQQALQETCEIFATAGRKHFAGEFAGKLIASGGMGGMGGAQALAATLLGAAFLGIEADAERIKRRVKSGYCDVMVNDLDEALRILKNAVRKREATSVGLLGNCADVIPVLARRGIVPDLLTDQTSAHDPVGGYIPQGVNAEQAAELRRKDPESYCKQALESMARHVEGMLALQKLGSVTFEYGNHIRRMAFEQGVKDALDFPGFAEEYGRPASGEGGVLKLVALSGEPRDIQRIDALALEMFPENENVSWWIGRTQKRLRFQGLPARVLRLGYEEQRKLGLAVNELVARGELKAPIAILAEKVEGVAEVRPGYEAEKVPEGPDTLNAVLRIARGASWVSVDRYGDRYGEWPRVSRAMVADGTEDMNERMGHAFHNDGGSAQGGVPSKREER